MRKQVLAKDGSLDIDGAYIDDSTLRPFIFTSIVLTGMAFDFFAWLSTY